MSIPALYATEETPLQEKIVHEHWVFPACNFHWLIAEVNAEEKLAFGYAFLNDAQNAEWGYISIAELESVGAFKDGGFKPMKAIEAIKELLKEVKK